MDSVIRNVSVRQAALNRWTATDKRWNRKVVCRGSVVTSVERFPNSESGTPQNWPQSWGQEFQGHWKEVIYLFLCSLDLESGPQALRTLFFLFLMLLLLLHSEGANLRQYLHYFKAWNRPLPPVRPEGRRYNRRFRSRWMLLLSDFQSTKAFSFHCRSSLNIA